MGKINEIQEEVKQSFGSNSFTTTVKENTVEFDSAKDSFTFKDAVEVPSLKINGQEVTPGAGGADWNANEGEPGYIENKPFYETIVGNSYSSEEGTGEYVLRNQYVYCKIDENYLSLDELLNRNFSLYNGDAGLDLKAKTDPSNTQDVAGEYVLTLAQGTIPTILSVKNGAAIYGTNFETGLYIIKGAIFDGSTTTPILAKLESQKEIKKISNDFIPTPYSVFVEADTNDFRPDQFKYAAWLGENSINFIINADSKIYNIKSIIKTDEDYDVVDNIEVNGNSTTTYTNIETLDGSQYLMDANVISNSDGNGYVFVTFTKLLD